MTGAAGRLGIGIIGAGRVGPVLGRALAGAGHEILAISAVSDENRERAEALLPGVPIRTPDEIVRDSQLVIFAIPAGELEALVHGLTETGAWQPGQLVMHTAAAFGYGVFAPAMQSGVIPLAFHPAMVFSGTSLDLARLHEATVAVTAPAPVLPIAQALAVEIGAEPVIVAEEARAEYADATTALGELTASLARQTVATLTDLGIEMSSRTVASIARAALDEVLLEAPRDEGL
ncbi:DUF2520 domain-containing protein [Leucobacter sp. UCMA 4100]|uniref:Rossmann-like and DUF2520 domain-containing protein n=1 Tax=Leucobacter sp. UCMA 4100 TaxID=2810534 RepID=UPI0022EB3B3D|nr:DUF2520 domain-containing protein [Leucobacter sp. UCMA 4100]MDA3146294.1 DUF2520 domain-containing protein [Leucobacter sp. UCMA 4100]